MKTFLLLALISVQSFAGIDSIVPEKIVTPFVDIFSSSNKKISDEKMEVRVSTYNSKGELSKGKSKIEMPMADYLKARQQASAVFRMIPDSSSIPDGEMLYQGTAFHIGDNLVLTNQHVLSPDRTNKTECGGFQLHGNNSDDVFSCKKVHYCNVEHDICLIEMNPAKRCLNFTCSKKEHAELKTGPSLKLKALPEMKAETMDKVVMTCIGNTLALGIHFSQGSGIRINGDRTYFFAPLRTGNSGGPLIGEDGLVWGVVKLESHLKVGPDAYNIAASMDKVIELVREQVTDKEVLKKFESAISK